jgi:TonB family protein
MSDPQLPPRPGDGQPPPLGEAAPEFVPVDPAPSTGLGPSYAPPRPDRHAPRRHSGVKVVGLVAGGLVLVTVVGVLLVVRGVTRMAHQAESEQQRHTEELVNFQEIPERSGAPAAAPADPPTPAADPSASTAASADDEASWDAMPELANPRDVREALRRNYPPLLRDAGVEGSTTVRFRVRADGTVDIGSMDVRSATTDDFARAALVVVPRMRFRPGRRGGKPAAGWVTLPVRWQTSP